MSVRMRLGRGGVVELDSRLAAEVDAPIDTVAVGRKIEENDQDATESIAGGKRKKKLGGMEVAWGATAP